METQHTSDTYSAHNIAIGRETGKYITTGHHNILVGDNVQVEPDESYVLKFIDDDGYILARKITDAEYDYLREMLEEVIVKHSNIYGCIEDHMMRSFIDVCERFCREYGW